MMIPPSAFSTCQTSASRRTSHAPYRIGTCAFYHQQFRTDTTVSKMGMDNTFQVVDGSTIAQPVIFEPVVNTPALGSFLFIAIGFLLLQLRIGAIKKAVSRRQTALEELRAIKANELFDAGVNRPSAEALSVALVEYESALQNEENMRTLIPGVRLRAPNNARNSEEDVSAAKQFLDVDLQPTENNVPEASEGKDGLSAGAVAVLVLVALSQIALLYMLSFDPMTTSSVF